MKVFKNDYLSIDIQLEKFIEEIKILGSNVKFESDEFLVIDSDFWQVDRPFKSESDALKYIENLIECKTKSEYNFYKWCAKHGLREGSIIELEDGKQGVILGKEYTESCLKYSPLKKDGNVSKAKRNLYSNMKYRVIKY